MNRSIRNSQSGRHILRYSLSLSLSHKKSKCEERTKLIMLSIVNWLIVYWMVFYAVSRPYNGSLIDEEELVHVRGLRTLRWIVWFKTILLFSLFVKRIRRWICLFINIMYSQGLYNKLTNQYFVFLYYNQLSRFQKIWFRWHFVIHIYSVTCMYIDETS